MSEQDADPTLEPTELTIPAEIEPPTQGTTSFDPLAPQLASGELSNGMKFELSSEGGDLVFRVGSFGDSGQTKVHIPQHDLMEAAFDDLAEKDLLPTEDS